MVVNPPFLPPFHPRRKYLIQVVLSEHSLTRVEGVEQVFNVTMVLVYYMYNYRTFDNDIMLLKVS